LLGLGILRHGEHSKGETTFNQKWISVIFFILKGKDSYCFSCLPASNSFIINTYIIFII
jgi:hypothetical protein